MKFTLILILFTVASAQIGNHVSNSTLQNIEHLIQFESVSWTDNAFYFRGYDPELQRQPFHELVMRRTIDLEKEAYKLNVFSKIAYYDLAIKDSINGKKYFNYLVSVRVRDANGKVLFDNNRTVSSSFVEDEKGHVYLQSSVQKFLMPMPKSEVTITSIIIDKHSGARYSNVENYIPKQSGNGLLVSDMRLFDHASKQMVLSPLNNVGNRKDSLTILFDILNKNKDSDYALEVDIRPTKSALARLFSTIFGTINTVPRTLSKGLRDAAGTVYADTAKGSIYYKFENFSVEKFATKRITISKSLFSEIEFDLREKAVYPINVDLTFLRYESEEKKAELKGKKLKDVDVVDAEKVNYSKTTLYDHESRIILSKIYEQNNRFTMFWENMPQTERDVEHIVQLLSGVMSEDYEDDIDDAETLVEKKKYYHEFLLDLKKTKQMKNEFVAQKFALRRVQFCIDNFSSLQMAGRGLTRTNLNDGYNTDKGRVYQRYGLPLSINGDNYISKHGSFKQIRDLPIQEWRYEGKRFIFLGNQLFNNVIYKVLPKYRKEHVPQIGSTF